MKLKYEFCYQPIGDDYMGVVVGEDALEYNGMLKLDDVSYDIVSHIKNDISRDKLIDEMLDIYDATREEVAGSVDKVLDYLRQNNLLVE